MGVGDDNDWWTPQPVRRSCASRARCADVPELQIAAVVGSRLRHVAAGRSHACSWS